MFPQEIPDTEQEEGKQVTQLVNITRASEMTGVSKYELRRGAKQGRYPFILCGNKLMFDPAHLSAVFERQMEENRMEALKCSTNS